MTQPQLIFHIGAPKCGSSTLQTALTHMPDLTGQDGQKYRYVSTLVQSSAAARVPFTLTPVYGAALTQLGRSSAYGYTGFPNISDARMYEKCTDGIRMAYSKGRRKNHIPILSNEGWIHRHSEFAGILKSLGNPPVDVVAFLRPPVEWLNASYWQWGVWTTPNLQAWMQRSGIPYSFGMDLKAWSSISNVRLRVYPSKPDIVAHFAGLYGLSLPSGRESNRSSPPALIGFFLRNRRFRPHAHQPATEFIFQRWCPKLNTRQPWAVGSAHVLGYRPVVQQNIQFLREILTPTDCTRLFAEPRWLAETPYHAELLAGPTPLDNPMDLPPLLDSLEQGILNAGGTVKTRPRPPMTADLAVWDAVVADAIDQLIMCDQRQRQRGPSLSFVANFLDRIRDAYKGKKVMS